MLYQCTTHRRLAELLPSHSLGFLDLASSVYTLTGLHRCDVSESSSFLVQNLEIRGELYFPKAISCSVSCV